MNATTPPVPPAPPPGPSSSGKSKKWILFGCGGCLGLIVLGMLAAGGFFFFVMGVIKKTDVYADSLKKAQNSAEVQAALGQPVEAGWMMQGSVTVNNGAGTADFSIPLSGPKSEGTLIVKADKPAGGAWQYQALEVQVTGTGQKIDLRSQP